MYAHTDTTLFSLDPLAVPLSPTQLGKFDCIGGTGQDTAMLDLAVDSQGHLWGTSAKNAYSLVVQGTAVHCATTTALSLATGSEMFGLSFAPVGVLDPSAEVLVGADTAGDVWSIDTTTGIVTQRGSFGVVPATDGHGHAYANAGKAWELSGDLFFLANGGAPVAYATVRDCPAPPSTAGCSATDTLIQLDPTKMAAGTTGSITLAVRGQVVKQASCNDAATSYGRLYGLAGHGSSLFGFSRAGSIIAISETDGSGCLALATAASLWSGAAVSPSAP